MKEEIILFENEKFSDIEEYITKQPVFHYNYIKQGAFYLLTVSCEMNIYKNLQIKNLEDDISLKRIKKILKRDYKKVFSIILDKDLIIRGWKKDKIEIRRNKLRELDEKR